MSLRFLAALHGRDKGASGCDERASSREMKGAYPAYPPPGVKNEYFAMADELAGLARLVRLCSTDRSIANQRFEMCRKEWW